MLNFHAKRPGHPLGDGTRKVSISQRPLDTRFTVQGELVWGIGRSIHCNRVLDKVSQSRRHSSPHECPRFWMIVFPADVQPFQKIIVVIWCSDCTVTLFPATLSKGAFRPRIGALRPGNKASRDGL